MVDVNIPAEGAVGKPPPPGAPIETSQPLSPELIREQLAKARQNERTLEPLTYKDSKVAAQPGPSSVITGKSVTGLDPFYQRVVADRQPESVEIVADEPLPTDIAPAASNTDSPTRGVPGTAPVPPGRKRPPPQVLGGFGGMADQQYFPLNGAEALTLARQLLDELHAKIANDLRFSMALTYPKLSMKLQLVVGAAVDNDGFTVTAQRREFAEDGKVETPPDAMRDELGIPKPGKHFVRDAAGKPKLVDVDRVGF